MRGYIAALSKYASFQGRAARSEFWQFAIVTWFILLVVFLVLLPGPGKSIWPSVLFGIVALAHALPYFAALARRLHDADMSGWWVLIGLIPGLGLALLVPALFAGTPGPNRFGSDPLNPSTDNMGFGIVTSPTRLEPRFGTAATPRPSTNTIAQLEKLASLRADGTISEAEFERLKAQLLTGGRRS